MLADFTVAPCGALRARPLQAFVSNSPSISFRPPMNGDDDDVFRPPDLSELLDDRADGRPGKRGEEIDPSPAGICRPVARDATRFGRPRDHDDTALVRDLDDRRGIGLGEIVARAGGLDAQSVQGVQRVDEGGRAPVENMVVGQDAAVYRPRSKRGRSRGSCGN